MLNLNKEFLNVGKMPIGKTQNIEIKIGRKLYYVDVDKNRDSACIDFYKKIGTDRTRQSKYNIDGILGVFVKPDALLNRTFFEQIEEIEKAQMIYSKWSNVIK